MMEEVPQQRSKDHIWVYLQQECPIYTKLNLQAYPSVFNWTMTYRQDSDVYHPYGQVVSRRTEIGESMHDDKSNNLLLQRKTRLAAWIVSSCDSYSKREYLVHELQKYITVDVYGWCGQPCPSSPNIIDCYAYISETYKFYLSFENSLCTDYITEKFFSAMKHNVVPVVYGGTNTKDYSTIAPNNSYIDTRNFKTANDLANYLIYLDKNDEEYLKYLSWKSQYKVIDSQGWCNLCQKVHEHQKVQFEGRNHQWYSDLWKWWNYMGTTIEGDASARNEMRDSDHSSPICQPGRNFSTSGLTSPDFEPGILNGRIFSKMSEWVDENLRKR